jgi:hypothetical protein
MRDVFGTISTDELFADLYPSHGQPAQAPWRLALVTVFQFQEGLSERQAAEAVRARIDWKYALSLELTDPRCSASFAAAWWPMEPVNGSWGNCWSSSKREASSPHEANNAPTRRMC